MPAKPVKMKEQYRLVMECRRSGLTDHQWCVEKGICPGTFYGWVRRLRQKGYADIPEAMKSQRTSTQQEIVRIEHVPPALPDVSPSFSESTQPVCPPSTMELSITGALLRIPNGTDPALLRETVRLIGGISC